MRKVSYGNSWSKKWVCNFRWASVIWLTQWDKHAYNTRATCHITILFPISSEACYLVDSTGFYHFWPDAIIVFIHSCIVCDVAQSLDFQEVNDFMMSTTCHHHPHAFTFPKSKDSSLSIMSKIKNPSPRYWGLVIWTSAAFAVTQGLCFSLDFLQEFPANLLKVNLDMQHDGGGKAQTDNSSLNIRSTAGLKWIPATSKVQCWCRAKHKPEMSPISSQCFENVRLTSKLGHPICCLLWSHGMRLSWSSPSSLLLSKFSTVKVSRSNQYIVAVVSSLGPNNKCIPCLCRVTWWTVGNWKLSISLEPSMPHWGRTRLVTLGYLGVWRSHWKICLLNLYHHHPPWESPLPHPNIGVIAAMQHAVATFQSHG